MAHPDGTAEEILGRLASRSHGVVTRRALLAAGLRHDEIVHRLRVGTLIVQHRGVYRVGHRAPSVEAHFLAAVLACGRGAALCGRAAAYIHGLIRGGPPAPGVMTPRKRRLRGVVTHRVRLVEDLTVARRIPITTVQRTLVDIAGELGDEDLALACHEAGVRYGTTPRHVQEVLARRRNATGAGKLRRIISGDTPIILSKLEKGFRRRLRDDGLELPEMNRPSGAHYVDCRWPAHRLTVELDSYKFHRSRHAWELDRQRERAARARGDEFRRYTWTDVFDEPEPMLAELRGLLSTRCASSSTA